MPRILDTEVNEARLRRYEEAAAEYQEITRAIADRQASGIPIPSLLNARPKPSQQNELLEEILNREGEN